MKVESIEERIANHLRPPERPDFFDEMWRRAESADRAAARRWRRIAIVLAGAVFAAAVAVGVLAAPRGGTTIDLTVRCAVQDRGGLPDFEVSAVPNSTSPNGKPLSGGFGVSTGQLSLLLNVSYGFKGYRLDDQNCHRAPRIPLSAVGLPASPQVVRLGQHTSFSLDCSVGRLVFRARMVEDAQGRVSSAELAVRAKTTGVPIAYVKWSPSRVTGYAVDPKKCAAY